jgi:hypothetical protein
LPAKPKTKPAAPKADVVTQVEIRAVADLKVAIRTTRQVIRRAKRHAKTTAAKRVRSKFVAGVQNVMTRALHLHEAGKMDDEYLLGIVESMESSFDVSRLCSYNVRRAGHALPGFENFRLENSEFQPVNDSAREILEAGKRGLFDRIMGSDNPRLVDPHLVDDAA